MIATADRQGGARETSEGRQYDRATTVHTKRRLSSGRRRRFDCIESPESTTYIRALRDDNDADDDFSLSHSLPDAPSSDPRTTRGVGIIILARVVTE